jgi:hypothetical protein
VQKFRSYGSPFALSSPPELDRSPLLLKGFKKKDIEPLACPLGSISFFSDLKKIRRMNLMNF